MKLLKMETETGQHRRHSSYLKYFLMNIFKRVRVSRVLGWNVKFEDANDLLSH